MNHGHLRHPGKRRVVLVCCLLLAIIFIVGGPLYAKFPRSLDNVTSGRAHQTTSLGAGDKFVSIRERFHELSQRRLIPDDRVSSPLAPLRFDCLDENGTVLFELSIWDSEEPWIVGVNLDGHSSWYLAYPDRE